MSIRRPWALALLLVFASCAAQVAAPRASSSPASVAGELVPDALYVRGSGNGQAVLISVIDARSGAVLRALPNGVVSASRSLLYRTDYLNGASQTRVTVTDLATGADTRSHTVDGAYRVITSGEAPTGLTPDGHWLVLTRDQSRPTVSG